MNDLKHSEVFLVHVGTIKTADLDRYPSGWIWPAPPVLVNGLKHSANLIVHVGTIETTELDPYCSGWI